MASTGLELRLRGGNYLMLVGEQSELSSRELDGKLLEMLVTAKKKIEKTAADSQIGGRKLATQANESRLQVNGRRERIWSFIPT